MSTNIEIIETLLLGSAKPLTAEEIVAHCNVKKKSITSAITRLSRRRSDLCRTFHNGRSYYAIGENKFKGELALDRNLSDSIDADGAPISRQASRVIRDRNGKFIKADKNKAVATGLVDVQNPSDANVVSQQEHLGEQRRRLAKMDGPQFQEVPEVSSSESVDYTLLGANPSDIVATGKETAGLVSEAPEQHKDVNTTLIEHRKELVKAMNALEFERQAVVKRVLHTVDAPQANAKFSTVTDPDLFRGWFNPNTGVKADRLGLEV